jgi:hypothetical protein
MTELPGVVAAGTVEKLLEAAVVVVELPEPDHWVPLVDAVTAFTVTRAVSVALPQAFVAV